MSSAPAAGGSGDAVLDDAIRFGVDRVIVRGRRVFGWGWAWHATRPIEALALVVAGDGWECTLHADYGRERSDVRAAFPDAADAGASGFLVTGYAPRTDVRSIAVEMRDAEGMIARRDVTRFADVDAPARHKRRQAAYLLRAVGRRIARGDWRGIVRRARAQNYLAPALADDDAARMLAARIGTDRGVTLVFDHNMGGGANAYREALLEERVRAGSSTLLCTYNLPTLDYRVELRAAGGEREIYRLPSFLPLDALVESARIDELFVNSTVSYDEPLVFAEWIAMTRARHPKVRLVVAIHDYFVACPSFVLLDHEGRYCGIPALADCERCLPRHHASYVALSPPATIAQWRSAWGRGLAAADEVRCFSESTKRLLSRAHPALDVSKITVVPHRVDFAPGRLPTLAHAAPLTIGIIGHISPQKGALVVRDMLARIDRERRDVRVVVIGTLDVRVASPRLRVTGAYARDELPERIEREGVNLMLFPSVCPETFSYAVEEMMAMRLPIVAFDLGAPAERLRNYPNARLCASVSADAALDALEAFHRDLAGHDVPVAYEPSGERR